MKRVVKIIAITLVVVVAIGYLAGAAIWSGARTDERVCNQVEIVIQDIAERQYTTAEELSNVLRHNECYPLKQPIHDINVRRIEDVIRSHPMVRRAECFITPSGVVRIELTQRVPRLRVLTSSESYFIDSDRQRMPVRESVRTNVMVAEGNIGERMARNELTDLVDWIEDDHYWQKRITRIRVRNPHYIELVQADGEGAIIIDNLTDYDQRLERVRRLYDKGLNRLEERPVYRELDARFEGQVVGRK